MDTTTINILSEMATNLTTLAVKGTVTAIHSKIESVKTEKNAETLRATYDEIINEILSEREQAIRIAQAYKEELDKVQISDEDIKHLHNTVSKLLDVIKRFSPQKEDVLSSIEPLKDLISVDTLKTMQLLGFNYKAAIGEPLTQLCANAIDGISKKNSQYKRK